MVYDVVILGAGALGNLIAYKFINCDRQVAIVSRRAWVEAIEKNGLTLNELDKTGAIKNSDTIKPCENFTLFHEGNAKSLENITLNKDGLIILTPKTPDLISVIDSYLDKVYDPKSRQNILMIQNGIRPELRVEKHLKEKYGLLGEQVTNHLISSLTMARVSISDFKKPTIDYVLARIIIGSWNNLAAKKPGFFKVISDLAYVSDGTAEEKFTEEAYRHARYQKALQNGANVLSAIFGAEVGKIITNPYLGDLMLHKIYESVAVAKKEGVDMDLDTEIKDAARIYGGIVKDHLASMAQDVKLSMNNPLRRLTTEIEDLDGDFFKIGSENKADVSFNGFFYNYMSIFTEAFNAITKQSPEKAAEYAKKVINLNRNLVGLDKNPPQLLGYSHQGIAYELAENLMKINKEFEISKNFNYLPFEKQQKPIIKIMRVDDEPDVLESFSEELQLAIDEHSDFKNYRIKFENYLSPYEALAAYSKSPQDYYLIFTDVRMPGLTGPEMVKKMREVLPVAVMYDTAYTDLEDEKLRMETEAILTSYKQDRNLDKVLTGIYVSIQKTEEKRRLDKFL